MSQREAPSNVEIKRVLIAEDDDDFRELLRVTLEADGFEVLEARDGLELLEMCRTSVQAEANAESGARSVDLVISDVFMPRCTGTDAVRSIRQFAPELPVVLITAAPDPALYEAGKTLGISTILTKPVELRTVTSTANQVIHRTRGAH